VGYVGFVVLFLDGRGIVVRLQAETRNFVSSKMCQPAVSPT